MFRHPLFHDARFPAPAEGTQIAPVKVRPKPTLTIPYAFEANAGRPRSDVAPFFFGFIHNDRFPSEHERRAEARHEAKDAGPQIYERENGTWTRRVVSWSDKRDHWIVPFDHPGRKTLWIDGGAQATPVLLPDVEVSARGSTLSRTTFRRGSRIAIELFGSPRSTLRSATAIATPVQTASPLPPKAFIRQASYRGDPTPGKPPAYTVVKNGSKMFIDGLPAGTYDVKATCEREFGARDGAPEQYEWRITVDGTTETWRVADFRPEAERPDARPK